MDTPFNLLEFLDDDYDKETDIIKKKKKHIKKQKYIDLEEMEKIIDYNARMEPIEIDEYDSDEDNPTIIQPEIEYTFKMYGVDFKFGDCCEKINNFGDLCKSNYSTTIPDTQLSYCRYHYRQGLSKHKQTERKKMFEKKMIIINI